MPEVSIYTVKPLIIVFFWFETYLKYYNLVKYLFTEVLQIHLWNVSTPLWTWSSTPPFWSVFFLFNFLIFHTQYETNGTRGWLLNFRVFPLCDGCKNPIPGSDLVMKEKNETIINSSNTDFTVHALWIMSNW